MEGAEAQAQAALTAPLGVRRPAAPWPQVAYPFSKMIIKQVSLSDHFREEDDNQRRGKAHQAPTAHAAYGRSLRQLPNRRPPRPRMTGSRTLRGE